MRVLITGSRGQLGQALRSHFSPSHQLTLWSRPEHDIAQPSIADALAALAPDVVINAGAWTNVDAAESSPDAAFAVNSLGPKYLAEGCARCGAALVQISSNEVFAGELGRFYREYEEPGPGTVYARSKAAGERAAGRVLDRLYIVRVAWLYGPGGSNFPSKIGAAADKHGKLRVVADEFGNPTYAPDVAAALERLLAGERYGIYHLVNEGWASRYEWAAELLRLSGRGHIPLTPIPASEWPRPAMPPAHAVLVNQAAAALGIRLRPWQEALAEYVKREAPKA
ncbi:MAG TPA: dTDP-4-dehydrorhamnose reductase [Caldilineaceae bacterium]|nr:dTDP-4-dehydrorhamnose reductase [Caldilineaceae bacterium]